MNATLVVAIVVVIVLVVAGAVWMATRRRRSAELREQFGPEYEHTVRQFGDGASAEKELAARAQRVDQLRIRPLATEQSACYAAEWRATQSKFVDDPDTAIGQADRLVIAVMEARGYPMGDFDQRAADVSVDHPQVVSNYRAAHAIAGRSARGEASTEDLRQAMVHYRSLFEDLIETREPTRMEARR
jgi:hypothetical protein